MEIPRIQLGSKYASLLTVYKTIRPNYIQNVSVFCHKIQGSLLEGSNYVEGHDPILILSALRWLLPSHSLCQLGKGEALAALWVTHP